MIMFYLSWICDIKSTHKYMFVNNVLYRPTMRIVHGLQVISNSHHSDVFFFVLRPDTIIGPYMRSYMF